VKTDEQIALERAARYFSHPSIVMDVANLLLLVRLEHESEIALLERLVYKQHTAMVWAHNMCHFSERSLLYRAIKDCPHDVLNRGASTQAKPSRFLSAAQRMAEVLAERQVKVCYEYCDGQPMHKTNHCLACVDMTEALKEWRLVCE